MKSTYHKVSSRLSTNSMTRSVIMSKNSENVIWFTKPIKGYIGARKQVVDGQEVWVKIAPTKKAKGYKTPTMKTRG